MMTEDERAALRKFLTDHRIAEGFRTDEVREMIDEELLEEWSGSDTDLSSAVTAWRAKLAKI